MVDEQFSWRKRDLLRCSVFLFGRVFMEQININQNNMVTEILITILIILALYIYREWHIKPKRAMQSYADALTSRGYKVLVNPYNVLYDYYDSVFLKNGREEGDPYKTVREEYTKYDAVISNVLKKPLLELINPELIKHYFAVDKHYTYPKLPAATIPLAKIIGEGLGAVQGQVWRRKRQVLNKLFSFQFLKQKVGTICEICDISFRNMEKSLAVQTDQKTGEKYIEMNIPDLFVEFSSQVIFKLFLGIRAEQKLEGKSVASFLMKLIDDSVLTSFQLTTLIFGDRFIDLGLKESHRSINRRNNIYREWAIAEIKQKILVVEKQLKENPDKNVADDVVEAMIIENKNKSQSITEADQIFNELSGFLFAGTDTVSHFLQMMVYFIAKDSSIEQKVRAEIDKFMSTDDYTYENLKNLTYIDNIQKETTRFYGPGLYLFWREAKEDNLLGQIPIRKGSIMTLMLLANHLSEKYFIQANKFRPERWEKQCDNLPNYVSLGFSAGARTCIGKYLAALQSKIALVKFMKRYKKIILPKKDFKMQLKFLITPQKFDTKLVLND